MPPSPMALQSSIVSPPAQVFQMTPRRQHQLDRATIRIYERPEAPSLPSTSGPTPLSMVGMAGLAPPSGSTGTGPSLLVQSSSSLLAAGNPAQITTGAGGIQALIASGSSGHSSQTMALAKERVEMGSARLGCPICRTIAPKKGFASTATLSRATPGAAPEPNGSNGLLSVNTSILGLGKLK
ncbi:hypothetical protein DFJ73DRAFT_262058 [Zopfochytrium polystomum]|nr:hypothetical protein DFJ73DRAFT_262058 [Zopfochytrium polystomum]